VEMVAIQKFFRKQYNDHNKDVSVIISVCME